MQVHHVGYAVKDINRAIKQCELLGYTQESYTKDLKRNVLISFMRNQNQTIELVAPIKNGEETALGDILKKKGPGPYHICYEVFDLNKAIDQMEKDGFMLIKAPEEACAIDNKRVAFMWSRILGMIELVEN